MRETNTPTENGSERVTVPSLKERKQRGEKIVMVTAYDYPSARLAERAGVDIVLVGDSMGMMILGHKTVVPVTLDDILFGVKAVRPALKRALLLADMPFGTYQVSQEEALRNAIRLVQEGGAQAVKIEGTHVLVTMKRLTHAGIPVMGHLGLTPQSYNVLGGHIPQGRDEEQAHQILTQAKILEDSGAFALLLEMIPNELSERITASVSIPTIGIGAGVACDGQVQVWHDLLGIYPGKKLRHVKRYAEIGTAIEDALRAYTEDVRQSRFPEKEHSL